jgi:hypothetical protein
MNWAIAIVLLLAASPSAIPAQAARVGRLPVLAPLAAGATCSTSPASGELKQSGIARLLSAKEPAQPRLLSLAVSADGKPKVLTILMGTREGQRGEGESVTVYFRDGVIASGARTAYTTGTPARLSDDHHGGLFPSDTAQAKALAHALVRLCRA